ncbi:MAG: FprA family A-type flavoprotein [Spirochaetales bacterium]|nr:FprA family A-type flavoprotein [Spirochaetales bacterium]MCF7938026.1 FprA family A-type flavoprotein [Spirochaetales bacterium]
MKAVEVADRVYRLSANIENGDLFEGIWPIPEGVSLNAYLVKGEKTALIDLVRDWDNAPSKIRDQLDSISVDFSDIDYLVLNHLEPDHTGWLADLRQKNPEMEIISTAKGVDLAKAFFDVEEKIRAVKTGESLDLGGGKVLGFYEIPNVHWPETMATFEYSTGVLFSCDAFGAFGSVGEAVFDDQLSSEEYDLFEREALRYYSNIVSSFSVFVQRAIKKLEDLDIKIIAPSHGIIWRERPTQIVEAYSRYASYLKGPAEPEITVVFGSMYGNTQKVVNRVVQGIRSQKVPVHVHQVPNENVSYVLASAWRSAGLVLGMPTYEYKMFPPMAQVIDMFERKHVQNKKVFRFGSFGWSGGAQKETDEMTAKLKWDFIDPVEWQGAPSDEDLGKAYEQAVQLAQDVKSLAE